MWDISYYKLIQISGSRERILTSLNTMTRSEVGPGFQHSPGEAGVVLYNPGEYPRGVIGEVSYSWVPDKDVLWIWCHPGPYHQLLETLTTILELEKVKDVNMEPGDPPASSDKVGLVKLSPKLASPAVMRGAEGIRVTLLENRLNRFRLRGPLSLAALRKCLVPCHTLDEENQSSR